MRAAAVVLILCLAAGCGEGAVEENRVSTIVPPPSTTTTTSVPASSTSTGAAPTTTTTTGVPVWEAPGFPGARAPEQIPWGEVGEGWLLVRYQEPGPSWEESAREGLFLIDPEDMAYAVGGWEGVEILDWSPDGRSVLVFDGELRVVDLNDGSARAVPVDVPTGGEHRVDARFVPADDGLMVRLLAWGESARLQRLASDGTVLASLAELDLTDGGYSSPGWVEMGVTWLFSPGGDEAAVATADGINLLAGVGAVVRALDTPGLGCTLSRWWDASRVVAACYDADWAASECWFRGPMPDGRSLWAVPVDGSPATRLTPQPVCGSGEADPAPAYADGLPLGDGVAARTGHCCECGGGVDFIVDGTVTPWTGYQDSYPCSPDLVVGRPGGVLVLDTLYGWDDEHGSTGMLGVLFEVSPDGTTRAITPAEPGLYGGVLQVLTTEETGG